MLEATAVIKRGQIYQLGRLYEHGMPLPGKRHFSLTIPGLPTGLPTGRNQIVSNDELVSGEIGQVGTQFDGLGHVGCRVDGDDRFYNGFILSEFGNPYGLEKLGTENAGVFFTREKNQAYIDQGGTFASIFPASETALKYSEEELS